MKKQIRYSSTILLHLYLLLWLHQLNLSAQDPGSWVTKTHLNARAGSLSDDGKILAYVIDRKESSELWIKYLNDEGNGVKIFTAIGSIESPNWSKSKSFLVFSVKDNGTGRIYRKNLSTNDPPVSLTPAGINCFHPTISPDESSIAYDSDEGGNYDIWTLDLKTFNRRQITQYKNHDFYPTYSQDGKSIAYTSFRNQSFHLFLKDLSIEGSRPVQLTQGNIIAAHPVFAVDGKGIFYDSNSDGGSQIYYLNLENYITYQVTDGSIKASFPMVGEDILIFEGEDSGVRAIRMLSGISDRVAGWKKLNPPQEIESQPEIDLVLNSKPSTSSFENDLDRMRIDKGDLIKNPEIPETEFETTNFDLNFGRPNLVKNIVTGTQSAHAEPKNPMLRTDSLRPPLEILRDSIPTRPERSHTVLDPIPQVQSPPLLSNAQNNVINKAQQSKQTVEDFFQPRLPDLVKATIPMNGAPAVDVFQPISLILERQLKRGEDYYLSAKIYEDGQEMRAKVNYQVEHQRIDIIPEKALLPGRKYRIVAGKAAFEFATSGINNQVSVMSADSSINEPVRPARPLKISKIFPRHQSRNNKVHTPVRIRFSSKLDPETIHASSVSIFQDGQQIPGELTFETNDQELSLKPYRNLEEASIYEVRIDPTLRSKDGQDLDGPHTWKFKTEHFSPFLVEEFPRAVLDSINSPLTLRLNREADSASIRSDEFFLRGNNFQYKGNIDLKEDGKVLIFKPYQRIPDQQDFQFYISPNLRDRDGNAIQNNKTMLISSRYNSAGISEQTMTRAREYFPRERQPREVDQSLIPVLEQFSRKGFIQSKEPLHLSSSSRPPTRYQVARWVEESLGAIPRMNSTDREELKNLLQVYRSELRNLGVDSVKWLQEIEGSNR